MVVERVNSSNVLLISREFLFCTPFCHKYLLTGKRREKGANELTMLGFVLPLLLLFAARHKAIRVEISKHNLMVGEIFVRD